jgi:hypothetical protein
MVDHDVRLDLSRRIDWRFLLPDPRLGSVVCIGCEEELLRDALLLFSRSVDFFRGPAEITDRTPRFDLVVMCGGGGLMLKSMAELVRPGGNLYLEVRRHALHPRTWERTPRRAVAGFERIGFRNVRVHWHWPSLEACNSIVPLDDGGESARYFFGQQGTGLAQRCKSAAGRAALATGLLPRLIGSYSVLGEPMNAIVDCLEKNQESLPLERYGFSRHMRYVLRTPQFRASRHVVLLLIPEGAMEPTLVVKVPRLSDDRDGIEREAQALSAIQSRAAGMADSIPQCVGVIDCFGHSALVQTALTGRPLDPATIRRDRNQACHDVTSWLIKFHLATAAQVDDRAACMIADHNTLEHSCGSVRDHATICDSTDAGISATVARCCFAVCDRTRRRGASESVSAAFGRNRRD